MDTKAVVSFSGGKDCTLALHRALQSGYDVQRLFTTMNAENNRSWVHGTHQDVLTKIGDALGLPIDVVSTNFWTAGYATDFEKQLATYKEGGITTVIFGDIDFEQNRRWCEERCEHVGLTSVFPLWQTDRETLAYEFVDAGFKSLVTVVDTKQLFGKFLGTTLSKQTLDEIAATGADMCGETGEYHTVIFDGPLFNHSVELILGEQKELHNGYLVQDVS
ncbi:diphthine--ammonia ligase [Weissella confusa]|uniref:Dph6-related ATP pyrophosphatase n=1 Tax=Weissella confusa TaxID=1583 RepID=UPI000DCA9350|nr:diphthine--ammonia ligase [Weissella confusa]RAU09048.1 diphthine--ammonia ligase [Weissella confusa]